MSTRIDRAFLKQLQHEVLAALAPLAARHQIAFKYSGGTYDRDGNLGQVKIDIMAVLAGGAVLSREALTFQSSAPMVGLKPTDLNRTFTSRGTEYAVTGMTRGGKIVVTATRTKLNYTMKAEAVKMSLESGR